MKIIRFAVMAILAVLLGVLSTYASAQELERFQANVNFTLGYPQNEFGKNVDSTGIGGSGYFLFRLPHSPVSVGTSLGFMVYGSETRVEPFSPNIPEVLVDVKTRNYIFNLHFLLRLQPFAGRFRPYLDGVFGFNHLWTETGVYDQDNWDDDYEIASSVHIRDTALSYGAGAGVLIRVFASSGYDLRRPLVFSVDLGLRYLKGGNAEYMKKGSIQRENGTIRYLISKSSTDLVTTHFGINFAFNP